MQYVLALLDEIVTSTSPNTHHMRVQSHTAGMRVVHVCSYDSRP